MAITLAIMRTDKRKNSTKVVPPGATFEVLLKENTSVENPTFIIRLGKGGAPSNFQVLAENNYCYCPAFQRYYFILRRTSVTAVVAEVECEVDVLGTYHNEILSTPAFVQYSESKFNAGIPDERLPQIGTSRQWSSTAEIPSFDIEGVFALTATTNKSDGYTGVCSTLILDSSELIRVADKLYAQDFWDKIKTEFYSPIDGVVSCLWTPLAYGQAMSGRAATAQVGSFQIYTGQTAKRTVDFTQVIPIHIPFSNPDGEGTASDFRNFEPYTSYLLYLPGVGTVNLPMKLIAGNAIVNSNILSLQVTGAASPVSGEVTYYVGLESSSGGLAGKGTGVTYRGNFGVAIPVASRSTNFFGAAQMMAGSLISGISTTLKTGALPMGVASAVAAAAPAIPTAMQVNTTVQGSLGGWGVPNQFTTSIEASTINWYLSDEPANLAKTVGRPYFHHVPSLGSCSGFVNCSGVWVKCNASALEHDMINELLNNSSYRYGGIIIE